MPEQPSQPDRRLITAVTVLGGGFVIIMVVVVVVRFLMWALR